MRFEGCHAGIANMDAQSVIGRNATAQQNTPRYSYRIYVYDSWIYAYNLKSKEPLAVATERTRSCCSGSSSSKVSDYSEKDYSREFIRLRMYE